MADSKLEIKVGEVAFSGEGPGDWLAKQLDKVLDKIPQLLAAAPTESTGAAKPTDRVSTRSGAASLTTSTAATKLGAKSGSELAQAAAYVLHGKGKDSFSRSELLQEMKSAKSYFKATYSNNLTKSLDTLVKNDKFLHQGGENYALSVTSRTDLDKKLA